MATEAAAGAAAAVAADGNQAEAEAVGQAVIYHNKLIILTFIFFINYTTLKHKLIIIFRSIIINSRNK